MKMHSQHWIVYALSDPRTGGVRYVGVTTTTVNRRLSRHISEANRGTQGYKNNWIRQLLRLELKPHVIKLEEGDGPGWAAAEQYWIADFRRSGAQLTNLAAGGEAPFGCKRSEDTRKKMQDIGRRRDPEKLRRFTEAGRLAQIGRKKSAEEREKIGSYWRDRARPEMFGQAVSQRKRKVDDAGIKDIIASQGLVSTKDLAKKYGITTSCIWRIQNRLTGPSKRIEV